MQNMLAKASSMGAQAMEMAKPMAAAAKEKAAATASVVQAKATEAKAAALQAVNKSDVKDAASVSDADTADESAPESESEGLLSDMQDQCNCFPNLSKKQRIQAAVGCYAAGALFSFLATLLMFGGPRHVKGFAFFYTVGNICSISSSMFLTGFKKQLTVMCLPIRRVACCVWITTMILTLVVALTMSRPGLLVLLLVFVQYCAMLWYGASYVPYGRALLKKMCAKAASSASSAV